MTDKSDPGSELRRFLLDGLPTLGVLAEAPQYGLVDLILPDSMAASLDGRTFLHLALSPDAAAHDTSVEYLSYGSPLLDRLLALAKEGTTSARWFVRGLHHPPKDLRAELARQISLPNAWLSPQVGREDITDHYAAVFWFRATILSHEKREHMVAGAIDLHSHRPLPVQALLLADLDVEGDPFVPIAPFWSPSGAAPAPDLAAAIDQAQRQAARQAEQLLAADLASAAERSARRLEAARSRLESFYADMAHSLEQRMQKSSDDKKEDLQAKLAVVAAEREKKLQEADEQYRVRLILHVVAAALIVRPMPTTSVVIENRYTRATLPVAWDTLGKTLDVPVCQICETPTSALHLCNNGHLVCSADTIRCSACKREYCSDCGMGECAVDHAPLCSHHQITCPTCGQIVCQEHQGLCHQPAPQPQPDANAQQETAHLREARSKSAKARGKVALPILLEPTVWELIRRDAYPGFTKRRQRDRRLTRGVATPASVVEALRKAETLSQLERLLNGLYFDAWGVWAEQAARFGPDAVNFIHSLVADSHPANRTVGALTISHLSARDAPLFLPGLGRLPPDIQATIIIGLGCSLAARSVPAVGETLWRLVNKLRRDISGFNANACWAAILALQDLNDLHRDDALLLALNPVGVAHLPHLLLVVAARGTPTLMQALISFAQTQVGTDLELQVIQALALAANRHGDAVLDPLDAMPDGSDLRKAAVFPDSDALFDLNHLLALLVPDKW